MKIVISAATQGEWQLIQHEINRLPNQFTRIKQIGFHNSGVGLLSSTFSLTKLFLQQLPSLVIQVGIAGSFSSRYAPAAVVVVEDEYLGDTGVVELGEFKDLFDLGLMERNDEPFSNRSLHNPWLAQFGLNHDRVKSISVNEISTDLARMEQLKNKYRCDLESMEGAALHYVGLQSGIPFVQIRGVSNYVGERNKVNWKIKPALENVAHTVIELLKKLDVEPLLPTSH